MFPWPPNSPTNLHATHHRHADGADRSGAHAEKMNADQAVYCAREWMGRNKDGANLRQGLGGCCTQPVGGCKLDRRVHRQGDRTYTKGSYPATHVAAVCTCVYRQEIKQTLWFEQRCTYTPSRCVQKQIKKRRKKRLADYVPQARVQPPPPLLCAPGWVVKLVVRGGWGPVGQTTGTIPGEKKNVRTPASGTIQPALHRVQQPHCCRVAKGSHGRFGI